MAEEQLTLNETPCIQEIENRNDDTTNNLNDIQLMDVLMQDVEATNTDKSDKSCSSNQERNSESPTTADSYIYKCVLCERILTHADDPKLLECLHDACGSCIRSKLEEQSENQKRGIECPVCEFICETEKIIDNQFLLELTNPEETTSKVIELKCSSCGDDNMATSWCVDCAEFICDVCVQAHQRLKVTKDHVIKPKEEGVQESQTSSSSGGVPTMFCSVHPHEKLSLFCENCDQLTCRDCQLTQHREHRYKFTNEIAQDARSAVAGLFKEICYKSELLNSARGVIDDRQKAITEKKKALVNEITQLVVKLTNTINVRGKELVAKLSEVCDVKQKVLLEKKATLVQLSQMTDHTMKFTKHALENGSDMAILFSKKHLTTHLQSLKCKRADIPNPELPVRMNLALDKVPDLIKVISTIGQIVVDGRVYAAQSASPASSLPPQNSPSPNHQIPMNVLQQHLQSVQQVSMPQQLTLSQQHHSQTSLHQSQQANPPPQSLHPAFQQQHSGQSRMLPPYGQQFNQSNLMNLQQNNQQNLAPRLGQPLQMPNNMNLAQHIRQKQMQQRLPLQLGPGFTQTRMNNQQQVTSSTHPQGMVHDRTNLQTNYDRTNLRGLLQPNGGPVYVRTGPTQYQAVQPQYAQQFQNRFSSPPQYQQQPQQQTSQQQLQQQQSVRMLQHHNAQIGVRLTTRPMQPHQLQQQHQQQQQQNPPSFQVQGLKWHTPQQSNSLSSLVNRPPQQSQQPFINDNFKITLKPQNEVRNTPSVSSTIPKTPSPTQNRSDAETSLDKYCADSVNDLMATIAKLDSNGVQVLAENRTKTGGSPHVDSSTGDLAGPAAKVKSETTDTGKDDPNEDWCAVCMDGGELVCCDKCPKVFHQSCHIPNLSIEENDTWQCLLCMNFADISDTTLGGKREGQLNIKEKKIAERIILELYCQYEPSIPFRELPPTDNVDYYAVIKKPIALDTIRQKLDWSSNTCYTNLEMLARDVRLMFQNAYAYNTVDSDIYNDAKILEKFFDEQLEKWIPEYAYETFEDDDLHPPNKKYKRILSD